MAETRKPQHQKQFRGQNRLCLIFDVETTGLIPKTIKNQPAITIEEYPYILQLSFVVYDLLENQIIKKYDSYIKIPDNIEIPDFVSKLTGITKEICKKNGNPILNVLQNFYDAYIECDCLVAHNMDFDEKMIQIEMERNRNEIMSKSPEIMILFNYMFEKIHNIERYCTMKKGNILCNLWHEITVYNPTKNIETNTNNIIDTSNTVKKMKRKWPRLVELYNKLFDGETPENLHNSMNDVLACLKCYLKMRNTVDNF